MNRYFALGVLCLSVILAGCQAQKYKIEGDCCRFTRGCVNEFNIQVPDIRQVSQVHYEGDGWISHDPNSGGKLTREYRCRGICLVKLKDGNIYNPIFEGKHVAPSGGGEYLSEDDMQFNTSGEQSKRELVTHADIDAYVFVLAANDEESLGWRVIEIKPPQNNVIALGDLASKPKLEDHPQRQLFVSFLKQVRGFPDLLKIPD